MESNGWEFYRIDHYNMQDNHGTCMTSPKTWYGYCGDSCWGGVKAVFQTSGSAELGYGNCYNAGFVRVYLNQKFKSKAAANQKSVTVAFQYNKGDYLEIRDDPDSIIKLNSLTIKCGKYRHFKT